MIKRGLTLIIPGLDTIIQQQINQQVIPKFLSKISDKGRFTKDETELTRLLITHFSDNDLDGADLPMASVWGQNATTFYADPCYIHTDLDRLLLLNNDLELTKEESTQLIAEIQPLLFEFGAELSQQQTDQWLLQLTTMPDVNFTAMPDVNDHSVDEFLPTGSDRTSWIRLWNEIQMTLHNSEINQQRMLAGKLAINSLWFWGAGTYVPRIKPWQSVQGHLPLLTQLVNKAEMVLTDDHFDVDTLSAGKHLWLADKINIEANWQQQLQQIDEQILKPLWQQLRTGKLSYLHLQIPKYGHYYLTPLDSWKFW